VKTSGRARRQLDELSEGARCWSKSSALEKIKEGVGDPLNRSVPVQTTYERPLRRCPLGRHPNHGEIFAIFVFLEAGEYDTSKCHVGRLISAIGTEAELEEYVRRNDLELELPDLEEESESG
jgi:hypothetical protein